MAGLLEGIRAVEFAARGVGPIAGLVLSQMGAEVIKIEDPARGDPTRGYDTIGANLVSPGGHTIVFEFTNRDKKSVTIDLTKEKGREVVYRLIEKSDVFFSNYLPESLKRINLDYETLSKHNPRLVYASSSSYGNKGPDRDKRAFDALGLARSGLMMVSGEPGDPPTEIRGTIADCTAGTYLAWGIVGGLLARERLGIGQEVDSSLFGPLIWMQQWNVAQYLVGVAGRAREFRNKMLTPLGNSYQCKDGRWIMVSTGSGGGRDSWPEFCRVMGLERLEKDPRFEEMKKRETNAEEFIRIMDSVFVNKTRDEWAAHFKAQNVSFLYERIQEVPELAADPQALANDYIVEEDHPLLGHIKSVRFPVHFSRLPMAPVMKPAPRLGQHTDEVMLELGYSRPEIAALKKKKVV